MRIDLVDHKTSIFGRLKNAPDTRMLGFVAPPMPDDIWQRSIQSWLEDARQQQEEELAKFLNNGNKRYPKIEKHELPFTASMAWHSLDRPDEYGHF
jgi:hypothetical protein